VGFQWETPRGFCTGLTNEQSGKFHGERGKNMRIPDLLVGGLEHDFYDFPYIGNNHPN